MSKSKILKMIRVVLLVLIFALAFSSGVSVRAEGDDSGYSEEEKEAAKAWLSAHGYPPTRAGAEAAYQDYLNGKFDDDPEVQQYMGGGDDDDDEDDEDGEDSTEQKTEISTEEQTTEAVTESSKNGSGSVGTEVASADEKKTESSKVVVPEKKTEQQKVEEKSDNSASEIDELSEQQIIKIEDEQLEQPKGIQISDILLAVSAVLAAVLVFVAFKAGKKKKSVSESEENK
jgi:hypothetical protein